MLIERAVSQLFFVDVPWTQVFVSCPCFGFVGMGWSCRSDVGQHIMPTTSHDEVNAIHLQLTVVSVSFDGNSYYVRQTKSVF